MKIFVKIRQLICLHKFRIVSPEFRMGKNRRVHLFECQKCGKRKIM